MCALRDYARDGCCVTVKRHVHVTALCKPFRPPASSARSRCRLAFAAAAAATSHAGNAALEGWGRLLLANEVTAARKYTQVYSGNDIYAQIAGNSTANGISKAKVATILFAAKASAYNWFDPDILTRHGIQWMPFTTAGSSQLLPAAWLAEAWPMVAAGTTIPANR